MKSIIVPREELERREECGIIGIISKEKKEMAHDLYFGLYALQHRGQEGAGIAVAYEKRKVYYYKKLGLVSEVFNEEKLCSFPETKCGIGHVRYSATGSNNVVNTQPVVFYGRWGRMAIAINGCINNCDTLKSRLIKDGHIFQSSIDSEVVAALINEFAIDSVEEGVVKACKELVGTYSMAVMADGKLIGVRDPLGLKPMTLGEKDGDLIFASETCAIDSINGHVIRDVKPGEIIIIDEDLSIRTQQLPTDGKRKFCVFEHVYLARSDSSFDGKAVYDARYNCGKYMAELFKIDADVVAGVPDSATVAARGYSETSGIPYVDALSKNRYVGRTFIQPSQSMRENSVKIKLNAIRNNIKGKRLILIDDSIVRGTTSKKIIQLLRDNGAKEIHMLIASPIVACPCFYGVDMSTKDQLIGAYRTAEEICKEIGTDSLHYLPLEYLTKACGGTEENDFCCACFSGKYPIDITKYNNGEFKLDLEK